MHRATPRRTPTAVRMVSSYIYMSTTCMTDIKAVNSQLYFDKMGTFAPHFSSEEILKLKRSSKRYSFVNNDNFQAIRVSRAVSG